MTDQTLPARMAASLAAALSSRSATIKALNETTNETDKDQELKKARRETAIGVTERSYGLVLKGHNELAAAAGSPALPRPRSTIPELRPTLRRTAHPAGAAAPLVSAEFFR
jgi:uncharacterized membrane protein